MRVVKIKNILSLIALVAFGACSPKVVGIYNPEAIKKQPSSFYVYHLDETKSLSEKEVEFDNKLVSIIRSNLESKNLSYSSIPDLYVSFMINVHSSQETNQNNYSRYDYNQQYNYNYYDPNRFETKTYKEGVLIIDIKNQDNKLVWQGSRSFRLKSKESIQTILPEICQEIISSFDPLRLR